MDYYIGWSSEEALIKINEEQKRRYLIGNQWTLCGIPWNVKRFFMRKNQPFIYLIYKSKFEDKLKFCEENNINILFNISVLQLIKNIKEYGKKN